MNSKRPLASRILLSVALCATAAALVGLGAYAGFTSTTAASQSFDTGTVTIELGADGTTANRLSVAATGIAPGDTIERAVDLVNTGSLELSGVSLTTVATASSLLDTDSADGLQVRIDACSQAWTEAEPEPGVYTYTCDGTTAVVLADRAIIGADLDLAGVDLDGGVVNHLRVTASLPSTAGNGFQGLASTVEYSFTAEQREGTSR